jgi:hypothetical protein
MIAQENATASRSGIPESLSKSGSMPLTLQSAQPMMQLSIGIPDWYPPSPYKAPAIVLTVMCVLKSAIEETLFAEQSVFSFLVRRATI